MEPPPKTAELEDSGAHELELSDGDEDHFSDAREGQASPIPKTRVERIDDNLSHGEVPGSPAFEIRKQDAAPDEVEVVPETVSSTSGGTPIPKTVIEKVDPDVPSHGEIPGTAAYDRRRADAAPDMVLTAPDAEKQGATSSTSEKGVLIPETVVTKVDSQPSHGEKPGTKAHSIRQADAAPDMTEIVADVLGIVTPERSLSGGPLTESGSPTSPLNRSDPRSHAHRKSSVNNPPAPADHDGLADDFDDFEEGEAGGGDDDFGDFDDGFEELSGSEPSKSAQTSEAPLPYFQANTQLFKPLVNFEELRTFSDIVAATEAHLDAIFPGTIDLASRPPPEPINLVDKKFPSERSKALWDQLIVPPPVQPVNWTKSNIRRAFLVSLGVPIDLDEILPASKQKKLILPSMSLEGPTQQQTSSDKATLGSVARLKQKGNDSDASVNSATSNSKRSGRRRGPPPEPELDLAEVRRLGTTTDEKLIGLMDEELTNHVKKLEEATARASELLEYWLKRRDAAKSEKEAFEGVIENLVKHARRVRK